MRAQDFHQRSITVVHAALGTIELRHRKVVLLLANFQLAEGAVLVPIGLIRVGENSNGLKLGTGISNLPLQLRDPNGCGCHANTSIAQQRLADGHEHSTLIRLWTKSGDLFGLGVLRLEPHQPAGGKRYRHTHLYLVREETFAVLQLRQQITTVTAVIGVEEAIELCLFLSDGRLGNIRGYQLHAQIEVVGKRQRPHLGNRKRAGALVTR